MVHYLQRLYFGSGVIFRINSEKSNIIDNPDQRITKDCRDAVCGYPGKGEGIPDLLQTILSSIFFPISASYYLLTSQGGIYLVYICIHFFFISLFLYFFISLFLLFIS